VSLATPTRTRSSSSSRWREAVRSDGKRRQNSILLEIRFQPHAAPVHGLDPCWPPTLHGKIGKALSWEHLSTESAVFECNFPSMRAMCGTVSIQDLMVAAVNVSTIDSAFWTKSGHPSSL
jgi:hypothetical protein